MAEKELEFNSFEEASQALRMELENLTMATEFPHSTFEIAQQAIQLAKGDEFLEGQRDNLLKDFARLKQVWIKKYEEADAERKKQLLEQMQISLNDYLRRLEPR